MQYLLMNIVLLLLNIIILGSLGYYFWSFYKLSTRAKKVNYLVFGILITMLSISLILSIVGIILNRIDNVNKTALYVWVVSQIMTIICIVFLFLFSQSLCVGLNDKAILLLGEQIKNKDIIKIINDTNSPKVFVFYKQGKRTTKCIKFSTKMLKPSFFDEKILGIKVEDEDAKLYIKNSNKK
ncbi:hypothetical protein EELLY_v1c03420 [Entomoplasma ellychniae]|uniref:Transmembrane protein n=1 Tax=Entomoplasma ellychniae TaxID=2114 RepID=A0A8E2QVX2_9MOLU|nr:hypothetical protein [Entomoplasma ellychniae]PPE04662.1 hypothetical protein EELLY_v1c03420 [Entomoplasma ellychniae]